MQLATGRPLVIRGDGILCVPTAAASGCDPANSGSTWADAAWDEITSGLSDDIYILGAGWRGSSNSTASEWEMDIGVGAAASEVVVQTILGECASSDQLPDMWWAEGQEIVRVPASTRIAARLRTANGTANACRPADVKLIYCKCVDLGPL